MPSKQHPTSQIAGPTRTPTKPDDTGTSVEVAQPVYAGKSGKTKAALLQAAKLLFWRNGYANVSLRQVAKQAGVDVALVGRYFGGKRGLFQSTLDTLIAFDPQVTPDGPTLIDAIVDMYVNADRSPETLSTYASPVTMVIMNAQDPEVGDLVKQVTDEAWHVPLTQITGSARHAALFSAALIGFTTIDKQLRMDGMAAPDTPLYERQMRCLLEASLAFQET